ncbi:MAG TPA: SH3 domain-containing protein [Rhodopila sp.]|nr:SH3 domain-containing protein [Rhodopila sp.]
MRIAVRLLLCSAWLFVLAGGWDVAARAETSSKPQGQPQGQPPGQKAVRLAAKPEEPLPLKGAARPAQTRTTGKPPPAASTSTSHTATPPSGALPLPIPPRPPQTPPPPSASPPPQAAEKSPAPEKPEGQAAKLPRFASLRADDVNMRVGPGSRYRIEWVYKRRDLPVEITREYDNWRYVRDADGIQGWMQQATLMGRRTFIVQAADATLREEPKDAARAVAVLKNGVIGRIRSCEASSDWCQVQAGSYRGYLRREQFWGTLPHEAVNP